MSTTPESPRAQREIEHGKRLAEGGAESMWGWGTLAGQLRAKRRAGLIAKGAGLGPGVTALEIGCGTGNFTELFAATGARIVAVDISPDLLQLAGYRRLPAERVCFLERQFEAIAFDDPALAGWAPPAGFDAVIGSSVLHHLDLDPALKAMARLLKPGGRLSFAEPNLLNPQVLAERKLRRFFPYVSEDEWAIVRWKMRADLERTGYGQVQIDPFDWLHPGTPATLIPLIRGIGIVAEHLPGVREFAGSVFIRASRTNAPIV